jgi:hypothetical protein
MDPTIIVAVISGISSIAVALISKPESKAKNSKSDETPRKSSTTIYKNSEIQSSNTNQEDGVTSLIHKKSFNKTKIIIVSFLALTALGATGNNLFNEYKQEKMVKFIKNCLHFEGSGYPDDWNQKAPPLISGYTYIRHFYNRDPISCSEIQNYRDIKQ